MSGFWDQGLYDPARDHGFWSPTTATANFCEEDYLITHYVAEFINTLSNLAYVYYALYPPRLSVKHKDTKPPAKLDVHTFTLLSIGLTSAAFHASLRKFPQLLDETSMYLLIAGFTFELLTTRYGVTPDAKDSATKSIDTLYRRHQGTMRLLGMQTLITVVLSLSPLKLAMHELIMASLVSLCLLRIVTSGFEFISGLSSQATGTKDKDVVYTSLEHRNRALVGTLIVLTLFGTTTFTLVSGDLSVHSVTFMVFVLICGWNASNMIRKHDSETKSKLYRHLLSAYLTLNVAFGVWLIDCSPAWCASLRTIRHEIVSALPQGLGTAVTFVTELHGWWHIGTARAAAEFISLIRYVTRNVPQRPAKEDKDQ